ncbi:MAG: sugar phosphate isomerase/epimerase [Clostridiales bacterium]|nr:sugar phosphate isomerase/epimerase [Clostridiales bacterium]
MKLCVSSYSFHQYLSDGRMTQLDCIQKAYDMGFDAIEFTDILPTDDYEAQKLAAAAIRREADRLGMSIPAYAIAASLYQETEEAQEAEVERLKGQLAIAAILGAKIMRHDVCGALGAHGCARSFDGMLPTVADAARRVSAYAETLGIRTCTENHGFVAQDSDRMERLFCAVAHDNYGLLVDVGNFLCVDEAPTHAVSRVAPYAIHAHVKDFYFAQQPLEGGFMTRGANYLVGAVAGEGAVPVRQCLAILKQAGYDGFLTVEYEALEDCMTGIPRSLKNVRAMLAELA